MEITGLSLLSAGVAFGAGILSFLSPCVLPLVPAYLGHLVGASLSPGAPTVRRGTTLSHALAFVLGFTTVFVLLWTIVRLIDLFLFPGFVQLLRQIGGVVLVVMGLHVAGLLRIPLLYRQKRFELQRRGAPSLPLSFAVGVVFAAGWTPCIGPILSGIIGLATFTDTMAQGAVLLTAYSLGLGVPFLLTAAALGSATLLWKRLSRYFGLVELLSGLFLVGVGVLMLTGLFLRLPQYFNWGFVF
ncbi:MAG TPA: cytochrome c biogenesis protein CcdA [Chloroflexota bacterium]|jgi:cytochrome c-type biogenesis protein|nr:cytochrome c biogenesis protein CcdA [Chloroflexota bacterium]